MVGSGSLIFVYLVGFGGVHNLANPAESQRLALADPAASLANELNGKIAGPVLDEEE